MEDMDYETLVQRYKDYNRMSYVALQVPSICRSKVIDYNKCSTLMEAGDHEEDMNMWPRSK